MKITNLIIASLITFISCTAYAEVNSQNPIIAAVNKKQCDEVKRLLSSGVSPNTKFTDHKIRAETTIIYIAISTGDICTISALIKYGADVNHTFQFKSGDPIWIRERSPLSVAIQNAYRTKSLDVVRILLEHGAQPELKASDGVTYVQHIINNWEQASTATEAEAKLINQEVKHIIGNNKNRSR